ncbi:hypothetical protein [Ulvibacter litoralis]|uniref:Glycine dehydrogenase n=1 Tax=Ulvibacter litoralis TaxID=227084 RepID=A0A1G7C0H0_9FLAO|nr:hypothetical protein [Ulvibacter litoralis]GHC49096.1 hypothetical protein GCM10008083_10690 [Ulvibacter litoralis]SDE32854.1 hypothetical protein SAMN05421855_101117 [Ulvibacter litoralis]
MKLFINCEEAGHKCDKAQYSEATIFEKIKLLTHKLFCANCRGYSSRNTKLTKAIKKSKPQILPKEQKEVMKEQIRQQLSK